MHVPLSQALCPAELLARKHVYGTTVNATLWLTAKMSSFHIILCEKTEYYLLPV